MWHQGESDSSELISEKDTYENMKELIEYSRFFQKNVDWIVARNSIQTELEKQKKIPSPTRLAQEKIISDGLAFEGPDTDLLRQNRDFVEKGLGEFEGEGLKEHGLMWWKVLKKRYY